MTLSELARHLGCEILTGNVNFDKDIRTGYVSDLLSDVIGNIKENSIWITIQRHINILGVAKLKDVIAIIIPRNLQLDETVIEKATEEGIAILRDPRSAFELSGLIYNLLHKG
jgi:serine kinase of HPr protein (carbohydrate metabolism regulator)